jgi:hypothetical protein
MKRIVRWAVDRLDRGECRWCGAPPEDAHAGCWLEFTDAIRLWCDG